MSIPISAVVDKAFDYIIVGGGTSGLVVANRLSSDPTVSVLVIEAGEDHGTDDPHINAMARFGTMLGVEKYDWGFQTTPQKHMNGKQVFWNRGKGLGGSSAVNLQCWVTPPSQDMDAIEALGNQGWNWNSFSKYLKRVSEMVPTSIPDIYRPVVYDHLFCETLSNMGMKTNIDPYNGYTIGPFISRANIDPKTYIRTYAANTYYASARHRSNLTVITRAAVSRVLFKDDSPGDLVATGAEFLYDGSTYVAKCNKEVIISAGTIVSPKILELSGIGRKDVLEKIGIKTKVDLPVGENLQDHCLCVKIYEVKPDTSFEHLEITQTPEFKADRLKFQAEGKDVNDLLQTLVSYYPWTFASPEAFPEIIKNVEAKVEELKKKGQLPPGLAEQYDIQLKTLRDPTAPDFEVICFLGRTAGFPLPEPEKTYCAFLLLTNHPFSRGHVHAKSSNPTEYPEIDPHYLEMDYDMQLLVQHSHFIKRVVNQEPFKSAVISPLDPTQDIGTDAQTREYIKNYAGSSWHSVGTCSMLPRGKNGVVSPELVVYGTKNLRVADLSIIPLHLACNPQSVAYAIGEKVADLILG